MSFGRYLHILSTALILTGFFSILITGGYFVPVLTGVFVTLLYSFLGDRLTQFIRLPRTGWNIVALLLLTYLIYDSFYGELDLIGNGINFVVYLQIVKILSPKTNRDQMQIYLLSFLHIIASTVLSDDITFVIPFLIYIVLATWTLAIFNLKLQREETSRPEKKEKQLRTLLRSKNVVTKSFLTTTSILSLSIISVTMLIFFSFPRLSVGRFFKRVGAKQHVSGFSEKVELGTIGTIKTNESTVLRVEIPDLSKKKINTEHLYWRGTATDHFDGRTWSKTFTHKKRIVVDEDTGELNLQRVMLPGETLLKHRVFLEPLATQMLFAADRVHHVSWSLSIIDRFLRGTLNLRRDAYGGIYFSSSTSFATDLFFNAESIIGRPDTAFLQKISSPYPYWVKEYFLQLPNIHPEVEEIITQIDVPENGSTYDKIIAIQTFLEENYRYTLDVHDVGTEDPLKFFFVDRKMGHCEYFSTAMVIALRIHGIPSRAVMGFRGGELNPYGNFLAVRQSDAHTWAEVFFPKAGWIRFDPSPLDATVFTRDKRFLKFYQFIDYLRLRWNKYVIEYDLQSQTLILQKIGQRMSKLFRSPTNKNDSTTLEKDQDTHQRQTRHYTKNLFQWSVLLFFLAATGLALWRWIRQQRRAYTRYVPILKLLAKKGFQKERFETLNELVLRVEEKTGRCPPLRKLTQLYYTERFGKIKISEKIWNQEHLRFTENMKKKNHKAAA